MVFFVDTASVIQLYILNRIESLFSNIYIRNQNISI